MTALKYTEWDIKIVSISMATRLPFLAFVFMLSQDVSFTTLRLYSADLREETEESLHTNLPPPVDLLRSHPPPCSHALSDLHLAPLSTHALLRVPDIALATAQEGEDWVLEITLPTEILLVHAVQFQEEYSCNFRNSKDHFDTSDAITLGIYLGMGIGGGVLFM